jgi:methionine-rich copper-binding protein CopC
LVGLKMKDNFRKGLIIILALLCSIILALPVQAGDGSGGGRKQPLVLVSSSPTDGQKDVALPAEIKMTFSKNVAYMTVRDNNSKCFAMYSQEGKEIPIEVMIADDQIEFDKRRDIVVKPLQELQAGVTYIVKVAPQLESKSGVNLGKETTLSFTTVGVAKPVVNSATSTSKDTGANVDKSSSSDLTGSSEQKVADSELTTSKEQAQVTEQVPESNVPDSSQIPEQVGESKAEDSSGISKQVAESKTGDLSRGSGESPDREEKNDKGLNTGIIIAVIIIASGVVYAIYRKRGKQ